MDTKITNKDIRKKFKTETGTDAIIQTIKEGGYLSGYPKKTKVENFNPLYTIWLENFLVKNSN